jgi:Zn-dependent protease/predicted transcriptional regulator
MGGFRIGRILGLEIRIDPSWLIIFFLVLWSFTAGVFPQRFPGLASAVYLLMGISGTLLFFVSVLLHEMAHSVVAMRRGVEVEGITLFVFGGIAHARSEFENARDEFIIAAAGPASSFLIAAAFAGIAAIGERLEWGVAVTGVASYLAFLNFILAVFNLLPGFPLDGGRLLRAAVWKMTGDLTRATRVASLGGKGLGYFLMALGLGQVLAGALIGGLWMGFIGWFVRMAAGSGYAQQVLRSSLEGLRAEDAIAGELQTTGLNHTLHDFVTEYRFRGRHQAYPVVEGERPVGVISFRQVGRVPPAAWDSTRVADVMTPLDGIAIVEADARLLDVLDKVQESTGRPTLVVREGRLLGVVTSSDVRRWLERAQMLGGGR